MLVLIVVVALGVGMAPDDVFRQFSQQPAIGREEVRRFLADSDLEILGVMYELLTDVAVVSRITPRLRRNEMHEFLRLYFGRCIVEAPNSDWADSRFTACWDAAGLIASGWSDFSVVERNHWVAWIESLLLSGESRVIEALETGLLEHVAGVEGVAKTCAHWRSDPRLKSVYERCFERGH